MRRAILACLAVLAISFSPPAAGDDALVIGLLPGESAPDVVRRHEAFRSALAAALDRPVDLVVGVDYSATVEALRFGRLDVAYLGPASFVLLGTRADVEPLVRPRHPDGRETFQSVIIVPNGSEARLLDDLRGAEIAFGDVASTGGHVVPRAMLLDAGLAADADYQARYLGAHDAVALAVARGRVAAGGLSLPVLERLFAQGSINRNDIRILVHSEPIPDYAWVAAPDMAARTRETVRAAILEMRDPEVLRPFGAERFVPAARGDYDSVASALERLDMIVPKTDE